jgi:hypothetical protein
MDATDGPETEMRDGAVPQNAEPGLYHPVVRTTDRGGSPALSVLRVGRMDQPEVAIVR